MGLDMKKPSKKLSGIAPDVVLGERTYAAIAAVEGLGLSASSRKRLTGMKKRNLSADQQRSEVIRAYAAVKSRG